MLIVSFCYVSAYAQKRSESRILELANRHFALTRTAEPGRIITSGSKVLKSAASPSGGEPFYFVTSGRKMVIVSGDERMKPILGYSDNADPDKLPPSMQMLLDGYARGYAFLQSNPSVKVAQSQVVRQSAFPSKVNPLLTTTWGQRSPYDALCPLINGQKTLTGCVATAMAQVINYHKYPDRAMGSVDYTYEAYNVTYRRQFDLTKEAMNWDNIASPSKDGGHAVSWLMACCGASVNMTYYTITSDAGFNRIAPALRGNFGYATNMTEHWRKDYDSADWLAIIKRELSEKRPVIVSGYSATYSGHCFVFDGYNEQDMVHVNWGFDGGWDGFYELDALNPYDSTTSVGGYNIGCMILTGIQKSSSTYTSLFTTALPDDGISLTQTSIQRNQSFGINSLRLSNSGGYFSGKIQPVLWKDGKPFMPLGQAVEKNMNPQDNIYVNWNDLLIPSDVSAGEYELYIATKDGRESEWQKIRLSQTVAPYFTVKISAIQVEFVNPVNVNGLQLVSVGLEHNLYANNSAKFFVTVRNTGSEWQGRVGVLFKSVGQTGATSKVMAENRIVFVKGEKTHELYNKMLTLAAGDYEMQPSFSNDGFVWHPLGEKQIIKVYSEPGFSHKLVVKLVKPNKIALTEKDKLVMTLNIDNSGVDPYEGIMGINLTRVGNIATDGVFSKGINKTIFIDIGKSHSDTYTFDTAGYPDGEYFITVTYQKDGPWSGASDLYKVENNVVKRSLLGGDKK